MVNASTASGVSATVAVTVDGSAFGGDPQSLTTSAANYTFEGTASGNIVVKVAKPSKAVKALYVKSIAVTYAVATLTKIATIGDINKSQLDFGEEGELAATITPADGLSASDYTVSWTEVSNDYITVLEDGTYEAGSTKGETEVTVTVTPTAENEATYEEVSKTFTIKIVDPAAGDGSAAKPYSPSEILEAIDNSEATHGNEYYVTGTVSQIGSYSDGALTYYISDDGTTMNQFECYKGKGIGGADFASADDLSVGDLVTVKGNLYLTSGTLLDTGNQLIALHHRSVVNVTSFAATATTLIVDGTSTTTVTNDTPAWTAAYTYTSDDETVATVDADGVITAVAKGTATITVAPNIAADDADYRAGDSKSIEITVNNPSYDVVFSVNGVTSDAVSVEEGEDIDFPDTPATLGGKSFVGWATAAIDGTAATATTVTSAPMGNADITYYAVYANVSSAPVNDVLNRATTGITNTSYSEWSGKTATSSAVYAGQSAGDKESIQLRSNNNNSGVITTTSGGKVKKIVVVWNNNTANDRTLNVYGKNSAYTDATDLYNSSNQGTLLGTIVCGTSTELSIDGDYEYIGFRSNSGAMYLTSVTITWDNTTYSDYCTTVTESTTVGEAGYATYVAPYNMEFAADEAYAVKVSEGKANLIAVTKVPAGTAVLLKGEGTKTATVLNAAPAEVDNDLKASDGSVAGDDATIYVLANINSKVGFYLLDSSVTIPEGKAYLQTSNGEARAFIGFDDETTGIDSVENMAQPTTDAMYNLAGQRVAQTTKGLYILNGRKVVVK